MKQKSPWISIIFNIALPVFILNKFSSDEYLGPKFALVFALVFPLAYGVKEYIQNKKKDFVSILGFFSILLTGVVSLFELSAKIIAIKEALIPSFFCLTMLFSLTQKKTFIEKFLESAPMLNEEGVQFFFEDEKEFGKKIFRNLTKIFAASFLLSAFLNFFLAIYLLKSPSGSVEFNEELAKMTALSFPVITIPTMGVLILGLWQVSKKIQSKTNRRLEEFLKT